MLPNGECHCRTFVVLATLQNNLDLRLYIQTYSFHIDHCRTFINKMSWGLLSILVNLKLTLLVSKNLYSANLIFSYRQWSPRHFVYERSAIKRSSFHSPRSGIVSARSKLFCRVSETANVLQCHCAKPNKMSWGPLVRFLLLLSFGDMRYLAPQTACHIYL